MNRAFIYGDLLFESIKVTDGTPQLLPLHYNRLMKGSELLNFETDLRFDQFEQVVLDCIRQNKQQQTARVRFVLHRNANGFYLPERNGTDYFAEGFSIEQSITTILNVGIYTDNYKACTELSNVKSGNALIYVLAAMYAKEQGWDDAIILNEHGCICEATSSNVFMVKDERVYTPALSEGCVDGVMRKHLLEQLRQADYDVHETVVTLEQLMNADAVFLTNAIKGVQHVNSLNGKQFNTFNFQ